MLFVAPLKTEVAAGNIDELFFCEKKTEIFCQLNVVCHFLNKKVVWLPVG